MNKLLADTEGTVYGAVVENKWHRPHKNVAELRLTMSIKNQAASLFVHSLRFSVFH